MAIGFVVGIVAFKPDYFTVAFESEYMGSYSVKEPAVMRNNYGTTRETEQCFFKCA